MFLFIILFMLIATYSLTSGLFQDRGEFISIWEWYMHYNRSPMSGDSNLDVAFLFVGPGVFWVPLRLLSRTHGNRSG